MTSEALEPAEHHLSEHGSHLWKRCHHEDFYPVESVDPPWPADPSRRPSCSDLEREESEAAAKREAWEPGPQAFALLDQLRKFVGCEVIIQGWDPIMFLLDDEGPYPLRATCVDVITRNDPDGHLRAYLAIKDPSVVPTSAGYDGLKQLVPAGDSWLFGIDRLYEIETTKPQ